MAHDRSTSKHLWIGCGAFRVTPIPEQICFSEHAQWTQRAALAERPTRLVAALPAGPTKVHSLRTKSATSVPITALNAAPWCAPLEPSFPNVDSASLAQWAPTKMCQRRLPSARHARWDARRPGVEPRPVTSFSVAKNTIVAGQAYSSTLQSAQNAQRGAILEQYLPQNLAFPALPARLHLMQDKQLAPPAMGTHLAWRVKQRARSRLQRVQVERSQTLLHLPARLAS